MPTRYPYTVTNSYKGGFFMRTYGRNVRRAWDGDDYRAPKRQKLDNGRIGNAYICYHGNTNENSAYAYDKEDNLERAIRETSVAALSSSPSRRNSTIFSLAESMEEPEVTITLTPPSSPPPGLQISPLNLKARKSTFAIFGKDTKKTKEKEKVKHSKNRTEITNQDQSTQPQRNGVGALTELVNSSSRIVSQSTSSASHATEEHVRSKPAQPKALAQTVLDFGQSLAPIVCSQCQMSYTPSVAEDVQLHDLYHNRHSQGIELGKAFLKSAMKWCYEVPHIPGSVVVVDRKISLPGKRAVQRALEVINRELGGVDIPESELWSQKTLDTDDGSHDESGKKVDRYKVFLHVIDGKCVGICLAERITKAQCVRKAHADAAAPLNQGSPARDEALCIADDADGSHSLRTPTSASPDLSAVISPADLELENMSVPAIVGVSRIWTSKIHRRKGIANNLLECVMNQFVYGMEIEKDDVAFSTPTELGTALARGWYGENGKWRVYREEA